MNINGMAMPAFKEFGGLNRTTDQIQSNVFGDQLGRMGRSSPFADWKNEGPRSPLSSVGDSRSFFKGLNRGFHRMPFRGNGHHRGFSGAKSTEETRLDARSVSMSSQSTELTIRTKDGDVVTIRMSEKERSSESLSFNHSSGGASEDGDRASAEILSQSNSSESFDLEALFENGELSDTSINFESKNKEFQSVDFESSNADGETELAYRSKTMSSSNLSIEIEGTLDEDELEAIGALVNDVEKLAGEFFDGDVFKAFQQARSLGYDDSEIAGYSLSLNETEKSVEAQAYRHSESLVDRGFPMAFAKAIGSYAKSLENFNDQFDRFFDRQAVAGFVDKIVNYEREDEDVSSFNDLNDRIHRAINPFRI